MTWVSAFLWDANSTLTLAGCPTGPVDEEPQTPDKDPKAMMGTEDTPRGKACLNAQDSQPSMFHSIKVPLGAQRRRLCHLLERNAKQVAAFL